MAFCNSSSKRRVGSVIFCNFCNNLGYKISAPPRMIVSVGDLEIMIMILVFFLNFSKTLP